MATPPPKRHPPHRWIGLLLSTKFWVAIGIAVVAVLAVYALVAVPVGPTPFSFGLSSGACGCQRAVFANHSFPDDASVKVDFTSHYTGGVAEYILVVTDPSGRVIVYANMVGGSVGTINYANTTAAFGTSGGGVFEFELLGASPLELPAVTAWVNGTYHAPILS